MKYLALTMIVALAFVGNVCAADEGDKYVVGVSGMT